MLIRSDVNSDTLRPWEPPSALNLIWKYIQTVEFASIWRNRNRQHISYAKKKKIVFCLFIYLFIEKKQKQGWGIHKCRSYQNSNEFDPLNDSLPPYMYKWGSENHLLRTVLYMSPLWQWQWQLQCSAIQAQAATTHGLRVVIGQSHSPTERPLYVSCSGSLAALIFFLVLGMLARRATSFSFGSPKPATLQKQIKMMKSNTQQTWSTY